MMLQRDERPLDIRNEETPDILTVIDGNDHNDNGDAAIISANNKKSRTPIRARPRHHSVNKTARRQHRSLSPLRHAEKIVNKTSRSPIRVRPTRHTNKATRRQQQRSLSPHTCMRDPEIMNKLRRALETSPISSPPSPSTTYSSSREEVEHRCPKILSPRAIENIFASGSEIGGSDDEVVVFSSRYQEEVMSSMYKK